MRILVTGGCGFIGSAVVRQLVGHGGHEAINVDKLTYSANPRAVASVAGSPRYHFFETDICDGAAIAGILAEWRPGAVIHLAAETHVDRSIEAADEFVRSNVLGTYTLLDACLRYWHGLGAANREAFRFLHVSTDEVYGSLSGDGRFHETSPYDPSSPYAASKAGADHLVNAWRHTHGLPAIITNCSNNYGPWQNREKLIPLAVSRALAGQSIPVYGTGGNIRDWLFVEDHAYALQAVLERGVPGRRYNVGGGVERTNLEVVRTLCGLLDGIRPESAPHDHLIELVTDRPGHDWRYAIDAGRIRDELGWAANESFESGLRRTVEWFVHDADAGEPARETAR